MTNTLTLQILNNEYLSSGKHASITVDGQGATIGANADNTWSIQNQKNQIESLHAKIEQIDGHFCISAYAPDIYLNQIDLYRKAKPIRLQQGDRVKLADFNIRVQVNIEGRLYKDPLSTRPEDIISNHFDPINEILAKDAIDTAAPLALNLSHQAEIMSNRSVDPMHVLDAENIYSRQNSHTVAPTVSSQNVLEQTIELENHDGPFSAAHQSDLTHLAVNPLFQGLKSTVELTDSKEAYDFLEEIGHSIKAVIEGLSALHEANRYSSDKHLRPIEDNPLHLGLSYDEVVTLFYSNKKCAVHLSAPAAFTESLKQIQLHQKASQLATSEALSSLLQAFSPQALTQRFLRYRRASDKTHTDNAWTWEMYCHYFEELTSNRQRGFEKLFWEIYQQSFDRHIRQLQHDKEA